MAEMKKTPDVPVTWDDLGRLAEALFVLTQANLSEEVLAEISAMLIRRIGVFGEELLAEAEAMAGGEEPEDAKALARAEAGRQARVLAEAHGSAEQRTRAIQQEIEAQAKGRGPFRGKDGRVGWTWDELTPEAQREYADAGMGPLGAAGKGRPLWEMKLTAKMQMESAQKGLEEVEKHLKWLQEKATRESNNNAATELSVRMEETRAIRAKLRKAAERAGWLTG